MIAIFFDLLILNAIFFGFKWHVLNTMVTPAADEYSYLWVVVNLGWVVSAWIHQLYDRKRSDSFESFVGQTFNTYILFVVLVLFYLYFSRQLEISRFFVSGFLISFPAGLILIRIIHQLAWMYMRKRDYLNKRILIIGYNDIGKKLAGYFENKNTHIRVMGFCEDYHNVHELSHYPILNTPLNAVKASKDMQVTEIYSTILPEQDSRIYDIMHMADQACIRFKLVPDFRLFVKKPMHLNYMSDMPILTARSEPLDDLFNRAQKRIFDVVVSLMVIIFILSWLIPVMMLAIWLESRGPVFFVQKRSGLNNQPFNCFKFRTMKVNADSDRLQAKRDDERFTRLGRILRKTNLDEFPQFFNVLIGNMSIVGPRPHMLKHTEEYSAIISKYMVRQFIKPGITGWAQVNGYRGETRHVREMEARVDHDLYYMENWSITMDLKIMVMTVYNVFKGEKNAF